MDNQSMKPVHGQHQTGVRYTMKTGVEGHTTGRQTRRHTERPQANHTTKARANTPRARTHRNLHSKLDRAIHLLRKQAKEKKTYALHNKTSL